MQLTYKKLESLYSKYNKFCYISPDPLETIYNYQNDTDREIAGLIASSLAYGNVKQILKAIAQVLEKLTPSPRDYIRSEDQEKFNADFKGFKYRFTTDADIICLLCGIKDVVEEFGSLGQCFASSYKNKDATIIPALSEFVKGLSGYFPQKKSYLLPSPKDGSACKRLMLYLRWMVRKDDVDPGCWREVIPSSKLIIPLDTHMYQISKICGYTKRKSADLKTAIEITEQFTKLIPADPVRYDFTLTRFGIRDGFNYEGITSHA